MRIFHIGADKRGGFVVSVSEDGGAARALFRTESERDAQRLVVDLTALEERPPAPLQDGHAPPLAPPFSRRK